MMKTPILKILKWVVVVVVIAYVALVIGRVIYFYYEDDVKAEVARIHATKLTMDDVVGKNLPPVPVNPDATVQGVDANQNGIRDDVELAIFKEYPNSARTRAVLLQYALALQMEVTQKSANSEIVIAVAQDRSRAAACIAELTPRTNMQTFVERTRQLTDFMKALQINTKARDIAQSNFYKSLKSYSDLEETCDLGLASLPN